MGDSCCIGTTRSGSGENLEGGGKEMTGEFISRENGDCGEREGSCCDGRTLGIMNSGLRVNAYAPAAVLREWAVVGQMAASRRRGQGRSGWWLRSKELRTPGNIGRPQEKVSHRNIKRVPV
jgi:hypothetical protein